MWQCVIGCIVMHYNIKCESAYNNHPFVALRDDDNLYYWIVGCCHFAILSLMGFK